MVQLKITLEEMDVPVWRRLLVPGSVRLDKLHRIFQAAMGWDDVHLHDFRVGGRLFGTQIDDYPEDELSEKRVTVIGALGDVGWFTYQYDFGDSWQHEVRVEERHRFPTGLKFAVCLEGQGACPPEDCGGPPGYQRLLAALADPDDEEHEDTKRWVGGAFDPDDFDLALVNVRLQSVR